MVNVKNGLIVLLFALSINSCTEKEKTFEVQGTIVSRKTQLPLQGLRIGLEESNSLNTSSSNNTQTDSLGRFIIRISSREKSVYLFVNELADKNGLYPITKEIKNSGLSTVEEEFDEYSILDIYLVDSKPNERRYTSVTLLSKNENYNNDLNAIELGPYSSKSFQWNSANVAWEPGTYIKYEIVSTPEASSTYTIQDSLYVPYSNELITDTIFY